MSADIKQLVAELRERAARRSETDGPFTKEHLVEWRAADALEATEARADRLEREKRSGDAASLIVAELAAQIPLPSIIAHTGTAGDFIEWFKQLKARLEAAEADSKAMRDRTIEECARVADDHSFAMDIDWWLNATKKDVSAESCRSVAAAIRSLSTTGDGP